MKCLTSCRSGDASRLESTIVWVEIHVTQNSHCAVVHEGTTSSMGVQNIDKRCSPGVQGDINGIAIKRGSSRIHTLEKKDHYIHDTLLNAKFATPKSIRAITQLGYDNIFSRCLPLYWLILRTQWRCLLAPYSQRAHLNISPWGVTVRSQWAKTVRSQETNSQWAHCYHCMVSSLGWSHE